MALTCGVAANAWAQDSAFPTRPVRIVTSTAAGGSLDGLARIVAEKLQADWGQAVIVDARPGANTMLATTAVARSAPDGYTVLFTIGPFVQNLVLQPNPGYKLSDFTPVSMVSSHPIALASSTSLPVDDIAGLVRVAKQRPGALSFGSFGVGSSGHVIGEGLNKLAGIQIVHVPYKGEAASLPDLISGQIQLAYGSVGFFARQVPTGKVKLLAIAAPQRLKEFPNIPTLAEAGYPAVNLGGWGGLFLPAGTPAPIADKWTREVRRIVALPDVQQRIADMGFVAVGNSGQEFARDLASEIEKWGVVVRANNIKLD